MTAAEVSNLRKNVLRLSIEEFSGVLGGIAHNRLRKWEDGSEAPEDPRLAKLTRLARLASHRDWLDEFHQVLQSIKADAAFDPATSLSSLNLLETEEWAMGMLAISSPKLAVLTERYGKA